MKKRFAGVVALAMSAIMSVAAMAAGSISGTEVKSSTVESGYTITFEAGDISDIFTDVTYPTGKSASDYTSASDSDAGKFVVKDSTGAVVSYAKAVDVTITFPDITNGVTYALGWGDKTDGYMVSELGEASVATASNGEVLADITAPTLSGQDVTIHFNDLTDAVAVLYVVKASTSTTGDVNPVIPVLAGVVVVSAAVLMFRKKRA
ncbi:MAG: LPXTG cell wall anchor domain-containing protein [Lachnospiraceae bacterium]|nr:LPXTG cell wall anchor domain-containing protein [Lachnospiraceae bacterium]